MSLDLIIRQGRLSDGGAPMDIAIKDGRIAEIAPHIASEAPARDAAGGLLIRGFADSHLHLDKACILERAQNRAGTLQGALAAVTAAKRDFTEADVYARGAKVLERAIGQGTTLIRTHVEIDPVIGLAGFEAVRRLKVDYAWALDLQICVFPQEGLLNYPGTEALLRTALSAGADLLGGCPYTDSDPMGHIERVFAMARDFDVDLDFHLGLRSRSKLAPSRRSGTSDHGLMACRAGSPSAMSPNCRCCHRIGWPRPWRCCAMPGSR